MGLRGGGVAAGGEPEAIRANRVRSPEVHDSMSTCLCVWCLSVSVSVYIYVVCEDLACVCLNVGGGWGWDEGAFD